MKTFNEPIYKFQRVSYNENVDNPTNSTNQQEDNIMTEKNIIFKIKKPLTERYMDGKNLGANQKALQA